MKELIKVLKDLNNHLSMLKSTADSIEKFTKELTRTNKNMDKVLSVIKELSK